MGFCSVVFYLLPKFLSKVEYKLLLSHRSSIFLLAALLLGLDKICTRAVSQFSLRIQYLNCKGFAVVVVWLALIWFWSLAFPVIKK